MAECYCIEVVYIRLITDLILFVFNFTADVFADACKISLVPVVAVDINSLYFQCCHWSLF